MPRVVVLNESRHALFVHHNRLVGARRDRFWVIPGGDIERGETSVEAAIREVREETGIDVQILRLLWLVEEIDPSGELRSQPYFLGIPVGGSLRVGGDPELTPEAQVIDDVRYFGEDEIRELERVYPEIMRREFWVELRSGSIRLEQEQHPIYRRRPCDGFGG